MKAQEIRSKFLEFFKLKGHRIISSASLIPENDPTVLFTTAGMHPLVPYLLGEKHPSGNRLADVQKCLRTDDIDQVGDKTHHTFFEMLGNWSLGDYWKKEAIEWSYEFLTSPLWLCLDKNLLAVSVFKGDEDAPFDQQAYQIWQDLGISKKRIAKLPKKDNWWGPAGQTGPCGPDTEMFYWVGDPNNVPEEFDPDNPLWVEIWNDVFMEYNKNAKGEYEPLKQKNVDTGMGLERIASVMQKVSDNYKTDLFIPIIRKIEEISGERYGFDEDLTKAMRVIADHIRAASFVLAEGLEPSNTERGYVLRRLIRRAIRYGKQLGINKVFCFAVAEEVIKTYRDFYDELFEQRDFIFEQLTREEEKFSQTLIRGIRMIQKIDLERDDLSRIVFDMYQSYGFPFELTIEELRRNNVRFDRAELKKAFEDQYKKHQELSRTKSAGVFKGGLADHSEQAKKYHTATHLLHAALRQILGARVYQKGSNITSERLRFDFSYAENLSSDQLRQIEDLVNEKIKQGLPVFFKEMELEKAKKAGALGLFENKYNERVKVYFIGPPTGSGEASFSIEICGGPHVNNTAELGVFKIVKLESIGQGVKRIKAVLE